MTHVSQSNSHVTPEIQQMVRDLCEGWQDSGTLRDLHALVQANLANTLLLLGNGNVNAPPPKALRTEAADIRCVADGLAQFLEHLAERIEARSN